MTSRLIILINEEINEANCMVRNSAKLDRRTKQHTQFGVSTSGRFQRYGANKIVAGEKKKKKKNERGQNHIASLTGIANEDVEQGLPRQLSKRGSISFWERKQARHCHSDKWDWAQFTLKWLVYALHFLPHGWGMTANCPPPPPQKKKKLNVDVKIDEFPLLRNFHFLSL